MLIYISESDYHSLLSELSHHHRSLSSLKHQYITPLITRRLFSFMQGTGIAHSTDTGNVELHTQDRGIVLTTDMFLQLSINSQIIIRFMTEIDTIRNTGTDGKR